jgi:hypothetical protein
MFQQYNFKFSFFLNFFNQRKEDKMKINMHMYIYLLNIINSIFILASLSTTNEKVQQLAFERFQLQDKSKPFDSNRNKHVYNLIYMPADLDGRKLAKHNIKSWWPKRRLTWLLKNHPPTLSMSQTMYAFERAFYLWSQQTALMFKPICLANFLNSNCINRQNADIEIEFSRYEEHDLRCEYKFGNSTLAHAFYPEKGIVHFNMDKNWSIDDAQFVQTIQSNLRPSQSEYQYNLITVGKQI